MLTVLAGLCLVDAYRIKVWRLLGYIQGSNIYQLIKEEVIEALDNGYEAKDIYILTPFSKGGELISKRIKSFLEKEPSLRGKVSCSKILDLSKINVMIYHSSKCLENKYVIVIINFLLIVAQPRN